MKIKLNSESIFTGVVALLSLVYLALALQMEVGTITAPGPGFMPVILGAAGFIAAAILFVQSVLKSADKAKKSIPKEGLIRFVGYLVTIVLFIPCFQFFGTIIAVFSLVLSLTKFSGSKGWKFPLILAAACSVLAYAVFNIALGVPLPRGIFLD